MIPAPATNAAKNDITSGIKSPIDRGIVQPPPSSQAQWGGTHQQGNKSLVQDSTVIAVFFKADDICFRCRSGRRFGLQASSKKRFMNELGKNTRQRCNIIHTGSGKPVLLDLLNVASVNSGVIVHNLCNPLRELGKVAKQRHLDFFLCQLVTHVTLRCWQVPALK